MFLSSLPLSSGKYASYLGILLHLEIYGVAILLCSLRAGEPCRTRRGSLRKSTNDSLSSLGFAVGCYYFQNHIRPFPPETPAMRRPYMSLVSRTTKITTIVIVLDVIAMVVCAVFVPPEQVRESLILTTVAFILLVAFLLYSLLWDAELASAYFEQLTIAQEKTAAEGAVVVVEGSENSSEQTVASRVVGITGVRLLDEESPWVIRTVEPWLRQDGGVLPPDPVVLRVRK